MKMFIWSIVKALDEFKSLKIFQDNEANLIFNLQIMPLMVVVMYRSFFK